MDQPRKRASVCNKDFAVLLENKNGLVLGESFLIRSQQLTRKETAPPSSKRRQSSPQVILNPKEPKPDLCNRIFLEILVMWLHKHQTKQSFLVTHEPNMPNVLDIALAHPPFA
jgi:hypothetical protein